MKQVRVFQKIEPSMVADLLVVSAQEAEAGGPL